MTKSLRRAVVALALASSALSSAQTARVDLATAADGSAPIAEPEAVSGASSAYAVPQAAGPEQPATVTSADLYCRNNLGTWFYCDKPKATPRTAQPAAPVQTADVRMKAITRQLDELKARAILEPTTENVMAYIQYQREQLNRASTFADVWQRAVWQHPELDYTLQRPVSTLGKRMWLDNRNADKGHVLSQLSRRYGIFYFYAQGCAACEIQSPILKSLAQSSGMHVVAVSMDGGPNNSFPDYVVDSGQRERMGLTGDETPALVLFDSVTKQPVQIGTGLLAADEIADRIFTLTNVKPGSDY